MGESERFKEYRSFKERSGFFTQKQNAVFILGSVFAILFIILLFVQISVDVAQGKGVFSRGAVPFIALEDSISTFITRPWTIFTYMFFETSLSFIGFFVNILWLWSFGSILQLLGHNNKIVPVFIYGGLLGGLFFLLSGLLPGNALLASNVYLMGAAVPLIALATAAATLAPAMRIFPQLWGGIPLWVLTAIFVVINIVGNPILSSYSFAIVGAGLAGFLFSFLYLKNIDTSLWMRNIGYAVERFFTNAQPKKKPTTTMFYDSGQRAPYVKQNHITQEKVDELLDKINTKGYSSLTQEEKNMLNKASREDFN